MYSRRLHCTRLYFIMIYFVVYSISYISFALLFIRLSNASRDTYTSFSVYMQTAVYSVRNIYRYLYKYCDGLLDETFAQRVRRSIFIRTYLYPYLPTWLTNDKSMSRRNLKTCTMIPIYINHDFHDTQAIESDFSVRHSCVFANKQTWYTHTHGCLQYTWSLFFSLIF